MFIPNTEEHGQQSYRHHGVDRALSCVPSPSHFPLTPVSLIGRARAAAAVHACTQTGWPECTKPHPQAAPLAPA